jgi:hypothetical protein
MTTESRRTDGHDDFPSASSIPPYELPHGEVTAPLMQWVLAYADLGWPVLPLHANTKRPATANGFHDASTDPRQVRSWWTYMPLANIGIATGVAFDVLDCDVQIRLNGTIKHTSAPSLHRMNNLGLLAGCAGMAMTRHGGLHLYFPTSGLRTRHLGAQHIDLLGEGSYVVAPPSCVPPDPDVRGSGCYTWLTFPHLDGSGASAADFEAIAAALRPSSLAQPSNRHARGAGSVTHLAAYVRKTPEGSRNARTYWAMCRALEAGQPIDPIAEAALEAGLDLPEVTAVVRSARKTVGV